MPENRAAWDWYRRSALGHVGPVVLELMRETFSDYEARDLAQKLEVIALTDAEIERDNLKRGGATNAGNAALDRGR